MIRSLAATVFILFASYAAAADFNYPLRGAISDDSTTDWTGFYLGANGGGAFGQQSLQAIGFNNTMVDLSGVGGLGLSGHGAVAGGTIGANLEYDHVVFGLEGDVDWSDVRRSTSLLGLPVTLQGRVSTIETARGRLGYAFGPLLAYVTGGVYWQPTQVEIDAVGYGIPLGVKVSANPMGWIVGGGLEYAITNHWSVKGEYLYGRVDTVSFNYATPFGIAKAVTSGDMNLVRGGVNYRF